MSAPMPAMKRRDEYTRRRQTAPARPERWNAHAGLSA